MENKKEIQKNNPEETAVEKIKKYYKNPNTHIPEKQKLEEFESLDEDITKLTPTQQTRKKELNSELAIMYGLENGLWTANLSHAKYYSGLAQMRRNIVKDFSCQTSLELMLADRIVAHYWRAMRKDYLLNILIEKEDNGYSFNQQKINLFRELYKCVEIADRQLNANIILLKELKQPRLNIKVTTENAFIAQNQQVNVDKKNNEAK
ncbi:MAG: hypothetical protein NT094_00120 [Candidatus Staskawiczbacteria bacterium]|nr:hypothetical protein [Candidatus Staskawiczbacteria bacterium]